MVLILVALLSHEIGTAQAKQHSDAAAKRSVLVTFGAMARQTRTTATVALLFGRLATALEQTAALGKRRHTQSEDNCCSDY